MNEDAIDVLMRQLKAAAPELKDSRLREIAIRIRQDIGGQRLGYARKDVQEGKAFRLGAALASGLGLVEAMAEVGVPRRMGYRLLRRPWVRGYR